MKVKNKKTGVESELTKEQFEEMQKNPLYKGVFIVLPTKEDLKPKEVKNLESKDAEAPKEAQKK